jgi:coproporphyrinogen III oxidase-like Fe-S oxidoreductase
LNRDLLPLLLLHLHVQAHIFFLCGEICYFCDIQGIFMSKKAANNFVTLMYELEQKSSLRA